MKNTPWLVIGAGAIGLFWACKLEKLGHKVHLVYRSENPGSKITLESLTDEEGHQQIRVSKHKVKSFKPESLTKQYNKVLLCTKSFDLTTAFSQIADKLTHDAHIACLCNGIGAQEALQQLTLPEQTLWAGTTTEGVLKIEANHIKHTGLGDTYFGLWQTDRQSSPFPLEGMTVVNIHQRMLEKLAVNAVINPITAIFNIHNGDILNDEYATLMNATLNELAQVFAHRQFTYVKESQHLTAENLKNRINTIAQLTRLNRSSMHEDVRLHRRTENDFISGFLLASSPIELPIQRLLHDGVAYSEQREDIKKKLLTLSL
ncbi:ketopantoate reductase family protein [Marinomonas algarum]|uniref:2-dehydropantoate 2-reductase n=1 Tax=Marinomonas algarum TaxID=2883105 RepID=A0A9X1IKF5_9GAMM|nr:2-dehydropantoate 2-reductase [Marinomonas algarum]MCB5160429.1 2-dehydropantoate 2-reductase [Marinomonas algarum]